MAQIFKKSIQKASEYADQMRLSTLLVEMPMGTVTLKMSLSVQVKHTFI